MSKLYGNAVIGQSGGPTSAINATLSGVIRGALDAVKSGSIGRVFGMRNGVDGLLDERLVDLGKIFTCEQHFTDLEHTPASALGACRKRLSDPESDTAEFERLIEIFKKYDIRYFFYIGGNDSMDTVDKLSRYAESVGYEMRVIGVPKTIDNDLDITDHTPGFGSAAKYVATSVKEIISDCAVYTARAVTVIEIMGRDAGWLTTAAALPRIKGAKGPDYIYLPERDFDMDSFISDVKTALIRHPDVVIAVSEGIKFADGRYVCEGVGAPEDAFGHAQLAGVGSYLASCIREKIGCKSRAVEFNISQRCAAHLASRTDIEESVRIGKAAVERALEGVSGHVMVFKRCSGKYRVEICSAPVCEVANKVKTVPDSFITPTGNNVTDECVEYLLPLVEGEATCRFENGIPVHFKI